MHKNRLERLEKARAMQKHDFIFQRRVIVGDGEPEPFPPADPDDARPRIILTRRICSTLPDGMEINEDNDIGPMSGTWAGNRWRAKK